MQSVWLARLEWNDKNEAGASQNQPSKKFCDEMVLWRKHHVHLYENDKWNNQKPTRGTSIKCHVQHLESDIDMWTNRHTTCGQKRKRHVGHRENDTWSNRERIHGKTGRWHAIENKLTRVSCSYRHMDCYQLATSLPSFATRATRHVTCQRGRSHVERQRVLWRLPARTCTRESGHPVTFQRRVNEAKMVSRRNFLSSWKNHFSDVLVVLSRQT